MKRIFAVLVLAGVLAGGAGIAWAQTSGGSDRGARRQAVRTCVQQARQDHPGATREELKPIVKSCLEAEGITSRFTPEQKAQAKACVEQARQANPGADKATVFNAARPCLEQAGLAKALSPEQQARRAKVLACYEQAKAGPSLKGLIRRPSRTP